MSQNNSSFTQLGIAPDILQVLDKLKFHTPTPIQQQAIPYALEGKDIMGIAQTGTGKTLAFGLPTIQRMLSHGGQALVLVPTRELALQVEDAMSPFLKAFKMKSVVLIGGVKISGQIYDIKRRPDLIVATPGRMNDHIYQGTIDLGEVKIVILDEADRMFDMGFEPQVKSVLRCVTNKEQTLLFSATMPQEILKLATKHMELPISIEIAPTGTASKDVSQELFIVKEKHKADILQTLLNEYRGTVLIFTRTKRKASSVTRDIRRLGFKAAEIHADRSMSQRNQAIEGFKRGRYRVLVATDIAARGIDVSKIELVINYDLPDEAENYVHRIGRTGRAGKEGHAVSFATPSQSKDVTRIERLMKMDLPRAQRADFSHANFAEGESRPRRGGRPQGRGSFSRKPKSKSGSAPSGKKRSSTSSQVNKDGSPKRKQNPKNFRRRPKSKPSS